MKPIIRKSKYFKYLVENADLLDIEREQFNNHVLTWLNSTNDELGIVLKCHLILEHYIDAYLVAAYPMVNNWQKVRLSFSQKLEMINHPQTLVEFSLAAMKSLNNLRNKFAHKLAYAIKDTDYTEIYKYMEIWNTAAGRSTSIGLSLIQDFTILACSNLNIMAKGIARESSGLGVTGYLQWLKKMTQE